MSRGAPGPRGGLRFGSLPAELRLTLLLFGLSFFISGVPRVYTQTAAHALFIQAYGAQAMPWAYLAEALCVPLAGWAFLRAQRLAPLRTLLAGTLALQIVALGLFRAGVAAGVPLVAGASIVYFEIEFVLSSLLLWGLANQLMTLRQGKRLFGFVSAGEPVAVIVCGLSTPLLLRWLSAADLFLLSALGAAVGIGLVFHILRHHRPLDEPDAEDADDDPAAAPPPAWWRNPYVVTLVLLVAVGQLGYFFVDSAFYVEAGRRYPGEQEMAAFLGVYSAVVGALSLVCSVLMAPWLLRRFGVRAGLLALPGLLLLGALATVLAGVGGGPADLLFLLVVGNKVIDQSFRYTLDKTTFVTLFQPLPAAQRMRVQAGLESMVEPLSGGLAGLLLFAMMLGLGFGAVGITGAILAVACLWTGLVAVQYRGYLGSLRTALAGHGLSPRRLSLDDAASRALLRQGLASARPGEVLYCLSLLDGLDLPPTAAEGLRLLRHPAREVRLEAARRAERGELALPDGALAAAARDETDARVQGALLEALAAVADDPVAALSANLDAPDDAVRLGAWAGLLRHGGVEGAVAVGPRLLDDLRAPEAGRRRFAALVMGRACSAHFYRPLLTLLDDDDPGVARAALRAAGGLQVPQLWPAMLAALQRPALERSAITALAQGGEAVLPALDAMQAAVDLPSERRLAAVAVLERMASPAADARLLALLDGPPGAVRHRVLRAVWRRRLRSAAGRLDRVRALLQEEVESAVGALAVWSRVQGQTGEPLRLLASVLADQVARCEENCFTLLALLLPRQDLHQARVSYTQGGPARRSYVVELLDNALDNELKRRLLPLLEAPDLAQRAQLLAPADDRPLVEWLPALAADAAAEPLLRAVAAYACCTVALPGAAWRALLAAWQGGPIMMQVRDWAEAGCPALEERATMLTIEKMLVLKSVALFAAVREEYLAHAAASSGEVRLAAGQMLFAEGDAGDALYVVASGRLAVQVRGQRVDEIGERDVVGEMAVLDPEPRSASVVALQDSLLLRITAEDVDLLMSEDVEVARGIIQTLCRRLRQRNAET